MTPCFVIVGYNNVRIYDVAKLRQLAHNRFDCQLVLVVERASLQDWQAADLVIQAQLGQSPALARVCEVLAEAAMTPVGILPFSDRGYRSVPCWPSTTGCPAPGQRRPWRAWTRGAFAPWRPRCPPRITICP